MCGTASGIAEIEAPVVAPVVAKTTKKAVKQGAGLALPQLRIYVQVGEGGYGSHHSPIVEAAHIKSTNYVKFVLPDGDIAKPIAYESTLSPWFADNKAAYEKKILATFKKVNALLPAAQKRAKTAHSVYDKAMLAIAKDKKLSAKARKTAENATAKKLATALKGAFASIAKIPGLKIVQ
jgi:hypothetical protein